MAQQQNTSTTTISTTNTSIDCFIYYLYETVLKGFLFQDNLTELHELY